MLSRKLDVKHFVWARWSSLNRVLIDPAICTLIFLGDQNLTKQNEQLLAPLSVVFLLDRICLSVCWINVAWMILNWANDNWILSSHFSSFLLGGLLFPRWECNQQTLRMCSKKGPDGVQTLHRTWTNASTLGEGSELDERPSFWSVLGNTSSFHEWWIFLNRNVEFGQQQIVVCAIDDDQCLDFLGGIWSTVLMQVPSGCWYRITCWTRSQDALTSAWIKLVCWTRTIAPSFLSEVWEGLTSCFPSMTRWKNRTSFGSMMMMMMMMNRKGKG